MIIDILNSSTEHPIRPYLEEWVAEYSKLHDVRLITKVSEMRGGDLCFLISCTELIKKANREKYQKTLVIHASDLPQGKGWSPHIWQVLEGKSKITVSLFEAAASVDSGDIWRKESFPLEGHELYDEINHLLFETELRLMSWAVENFKTVKPQAQPAYEGSMYPKRQPKDSELDPKKSIESQFNLLRVCDPHRFPAYFYHKGHKYTVQIKKADRSGDS